MDSRARRPLLVTTVAIVFLFGNAPSGNERLPISQALLDGQWPASWIAAPGASARDPGVYHFRRVVDLDHAPGRVLVHVSADNRYVLHVNGRRVGAGPARGDVLNWPFETYDLAPFLSRGPNIVAATVWNFGTLAPMAQMSRRTGFLLQADDDAFASLNTGTAWEAQIARGHQPNPDALKDIRARHFYYSAGPGERRDGRAWDWQWDARESPAGRWHQAIALMRAHPRSISQGPGWMRSPEGWLLVPGRLPPMLHEPDTAGRIVRATGTSAQAVPVVVPAHSAVTLLFDRGEIVNAYPSLTSSGGRDAVMRVTYAEALYDGQGQKGQRNEIEGKEILGLFDEFIGDGGDRRTFAPLWFRTWRFLEVHITTSAEPLRLEAVEAVRTGFPLVARAVFESPDPELRRIWDVGWRTALLAAHETYMDAPYWEQLQYIGDTRIDALLSYIVANDDRLGRRALELFDQSRLADGITQSRYPTSEMQYIPPYALFFVSMVHDFWMYRDDPFFVRERLPATRSVLEWFIERQRPDGLLGRLPFWVHGDTSTVLDDAIQDADGGSGVITFQFAGTLREAAALEEALGERWRAERYMRHAERAASAASRLWDDLRGLYADTPARQSWGHPVNVFALLFGDVPAARRERLLQNVLAIANHPAGRSASGGPGAAWPLEEIPSASYYFRFYVARVLEQHGRADAYIPLLDPWRQMLALGLSTWAEHPEPTRSDCHAWSAHPTMDLLRVVAGVRPVAPGFSRVRIAPGLGPLPSLEAVHPTVRGDIVVELAASGDRLDGTVALPEGMSGELFWRGRVQELRAGPQRVSFR
jgi:alpha-L-rhamnosidase